MQVSIWPTTVLGWVTLIGGTLTVVTALGAALGGWLSKRLVAMEQRIRNDMNGIGERVDTVEAACHAHGQAIVDVQRIQQNAEFDRARLHEDFGELRGVLEEIKEGINKRNDAQEKDARRWIDKLARIETKLGISPQGERGND